MVDPEPSPELIPTFYQADYGPYAPPASGEHEDARRSFKYRIARWRHAGSEGDHPTRRVQSLAGRAVEFVTGKTVSYSLGLPLQLPKQARILELGYGSGGWLQAMAALGYTRLAGYDIGANGENTSRLLALGIEVSTGDFLSNDYAQGAYDCIRLEHVFEHLLRPVDVLAKCRTLLRPGGLLVMTLPCIESISGRVSLVHSPNGVELPRHLYHHTARSATLMLQKAGLKRVRSLVYGDGSSFVATVNGVLRERSLPSLPRALGNLVSPAYRLVSRALSQGELLTLVANA